MLRSSQQDHYVLQISPDSGTAFEGEGRRVKADRTQLLLMDATRPRNVRFAGRTLTLLLPRDELDALLPGAFGLSGILPQGATASLLYSHLQAL